MKFQSTRCTDFKVGIFWVSHHSCIADYSPLSYIYNYCKILRDTLYMDGYVSLIPVGGGGGISGMNLVQMCRWASSYPPYKCILEYGKSIPINVYTIIGDNNKYSLFPLRLGSFVQTNHQFSQLLDYKLIFIRKQQDKNQVVRLSTAGD